MTATTSDAPHLRILAVSGSRADWGYLVKPIEALKADPAFDVLLAVTGQHLEERSGRTIDNIRNAGFAVDDIIEPHLAGDSAEETTAALAHIASGMGKVIAARKPHLMLLLGDRYETLACASAAMLARVPIAHLCGGDISEGAVDDVIRHAVSKLSHLHFPTNSDAARRLRQMGEAPERVHMVGSTGLDLLLATPIMPRDDFFARLKLQPRKHMLLVTMHPVTLAADPAAEAKALVTALAALGDDVELIISGTNADTGRHGITRLLENLAATRSGTVLVPSLGNALFVNALAHCDCMVGNSSSGLYEAPSLGIPTVNVGIRQQGRLRASSVTDCAAEPEVIRAAIVAALGRGRVSTRNPYGDGHASRRIVEVLKALGDPALLLHKTFHEVGEEP